MSKKEKVIKNSLFFSIYLLFSWTLYRLIFRFPEEVDELIFKPLLWLLPIFFILRREKKGISFLGITTKNLISSTYFALALGIGFALEGVILNYIKYKGLNFSAELGQDLFIVAFLLSFATAITEEITFRGYLFNRVWKATKSEWSANFLTSFVWGLIHLPIAFIWLNLGLTQTFGFVALITLFGIGSAFVFARTGNIFSSILLHVFWAWPIMLFR
jgi:membrane protease YdiL (CAAX protease family)